MQVYDPAHHEKKARNRWHVFPTFSNSERPKTIRGNGRIATQSSDSTQSPTPTKNAKKFERNVL